MLAIFKTGGKQYSVKAGQILKVEKLDGIKGDAISFNDVLAISDENKHTIGSPMVQGATVEAKILDQIRDKKIIIFKKRQRQNYRHTQGHRQYLTVLKIESIEMDGKKTSAPVKEKKDIKAKSTAEMDGKKSSAPVKEKKDIKAKSTLIKKKAAPKKAVALKKKTTKKA